MTWIRCYKEQIAIGPTHIVRMCPIKGSMCIRFEMCIPSIVCYENGIKYVMIGGDIRIHVSLYLEI